MFNGPEVCIVLAVVLLVFGGSQLPKLARNLGKAQKEFKDGLAEGREADEATTKTKTSTTSRQPRTDAAGPTEPPADVLSLVTNSAHQGRNARSRRTRPPSDGAT